MMTGKQARPRTAFPRSRALFPLLVCALLATAPALWAEDASEGEEIEHHNELALILAGTYEGDEEASFFTIGAEYQYRLIPLLGVGCAFEKVFESGTREYILVFPVFLHPVGGLEVLTGPGFERADDSNRFLYRVGVAYGFEFAERYSISPSLEFDFIDGDDGVSHSIVYGVNLGISF